VKYVNPGMPQLFEYQTLNKLSVGIEDEFEHSRTGYYVDLSSNDSDVFYKMLNNVKEFYILFDLMIGKDVDSTNVISNWVKVFDFYNDKTPNQNLKLCYKQYKPTKFQLAILTNSNNIIGNVWYVNANEINTFELHITRNVITNVEVYVNCKLDQTIIDNTIGDDIINRFNFYCNYGDNMSVCLSHIIFNDLNKIGNERIKMLKTNMSQAIIANGSQQTFMITELLNENLYKDITGFGVASIIENGDINKTNIEEYLSNNIIDSFSVDPNMTKYNNTYLEKDPNTSSNFKSTDITNRKILINAKNN
jgi:hypothetical protein